MSAVVTGPEGFAPDVIQKQSLRPSQEVSQATLEQLRSPQVYHTLEEYTASDRVQTKSRPPIDTIVNLSEAQRAYKIPDGPLQLADEVVRLAELEAFEKQRAMEIRLEQSLERRKLLIQKMQAGHLAALMGTITSDPELWLRYLPHYAQEVRHRPPEHHDESTLEARLEHADATREHLRLLFTSLMGDRGKIRRLVVEAMNAEMHDQARRRKQDIENTIAQIQEYGPDHLDPTALATHLLYDEVVVGGGIHAAIYNTAMSYVQPHLKSLTVEAGDRISANFGYVQDFLRMNTLNRPPFEEDSIHINKMNLNYLGEHAILQVSDLEAVRYPTPRAVVDASTINQYFANNDLLFNTQVAEVTEMEDGQPARYKVGFRDGSFVFANRVIYATGAGIPVWPKMRDEASNQLLNQYKEQPQNPGELPGVSDYASFVRTALENERLLRSLGGKKVHIIGGGASGYTVAEYLYGLATEAAYNRSVATDLGKHGRPKISLADRSIAPNREAFLAKPWTRYLMLADAYPTTAELAEEGQEAPDQVLMVEENEHYKPDSPHPLEKYKYISWIAKPNGKMDIRYCNEYSMRAQNQDRIQPIPARLVAVEELAKSDIRGRFRLTYSTPDIDRETGQPISHDRYEFADYIIFAAGYSNSAIGDSLKAFVPKLDPSARGNPFKDPILGREVYYQHPNAGQPALITTGIQLEGHELYGMGPAASEISMEEASRLGAGSDLISLGAYNIALPGQGPRSEAMALKFGEKPVAHLPRPERKDAQIALYAAPQGVDRIILRSPETIQATDPRELMTSIKYHLGALFKAFTFNREELLLTFTKRTAALELSFNVPLEESTGQTLVKKIEQDQELLELLTMAVSGPKETLTFGIPFMPNERVNVRDIGQIRLPKRAALAPRA